MCGTIDPWSCIWWVLGFGIKTEYDNYMPYGTLKLKKKEFTELDQENMMVNEYLNQFFQLSRYAINNVNTNEM
jgi:hypothetical protein